MTVVGGSEDGADRVLIRPFLLSYVNHVLLLTSNVKHNFQTKNEVCIKTKSSPASHSYKGQDTKRTTVKWFVFMTAVFL